MKPPPFEYFAPETVADATELLQRYDGEARVLAGGQSLVPLLNMRLARPAALVDLNRTTGLDYIRESDGALVVGAMTRQRSVERSEAVERVQPLVAAATAHIGHPQIRNRGTVGGSLSHAHPASELQAAAVALDARFTLTGPRGQRRLTADSFFLTYLTTAVEPDEILTEVAWPALPDGAGWSFQEVTRRHGDFALAGVAVVVVPDRAGRCAEARIALFGVAPTAVRARSAERALAGAALEQRAIEEVGRTAATDIDTPPSDVHASADYRRHLVGVLTRRALVEAATRARLAA
jgi:carbon-monoxide dehydrogenase medium subunit